MKVSTIFDFKGFIFKDKYIFERCYFNEKSSNLGSSQLNAIIDLIALGLYNVAKSVYTWFQQINT